jgi:hypothetical protein
MNETRFGIVNRNRASGLSERKRDSHRI